MSKINQIEFGGVAGFIPSYIIDRSFGIPYDIRPSSVLSTEHDMGPTGVILNMRIDIQAGHKPQDSGFTLDRDLACHSTVIYFVELTSVLGT